MDAMKNALAFQWVQAKVRKNLFYIYIEFTYNDRDIDLSSFKFKHRISLFAN